MQSSDDTIILHTGESYKYRVSLDKKLILEKIGSLPVHDPVLQE